MTAATCSTLLLLLFFFLSSSSLAKFFLSLSLLERVSGTLSEDEFEPTNVKKANHCYHHQPLRGPCRRTVLGKCKKESQADFQARQFRKEYLVSKGIANELMRKSSKPTNLIQHNENEDETGSPNFERTFRPEWKPYLKHPILSALIFSNTESNEFRFLVPLLFRWSLEELCSTIW